jgi:hypothetical protein
MSFLQIWFRSYCRAGKMSELGRWHWSGRVEPGVPYLRQVLQLGWKEASVAPWEGFEAEIEKPIEFVERNTHVKANLGGGQAVAAGFLHDGETVEVKPADGVWVDFFDGGLLFGFEACAERGNAVSQ